MSKFLEREVSSEDLEDLPLIIGPGDARYSEFHGMLRALAYRLARLAQASDDEPAEPEAERDPE